MVSATMERALQFLRNHKDVALATSEDNILKLRIFLKSYLSIFY